MEHSTRPLGQSEALRKGFERQAKVARQLAELSLGEVDEALIEYQINTMGVDPSHLIDPVADLSWILRDSVAKGMTETEADLIMFDFVTYLEKNPLG